MPASFISIFIAIGNIGISEFLELTLQRPSLVSSLKNWEICHIILFTCYWIACLLHLYSSVVKLWQKFRLWKVLDETLPPWIQVVGVFFSQLNQRELFWLEILIYEMFLASCCCTVLFKEYIFCRHRKKFFSGYVALKTKIASKSILFLNVSVTSMRSIEIIYLFSRSLYLR